MSHPETKNAFKYYRGHHSALPVWSVIVIVSEDGRLTFRDFKFPSLTTKEAKARFLDEAEIAALSYKERHLKKE